jgi:leader peptidase (prepilin peptidase)/N-methyltransferase
MAKYQLLIWGMKLIWLCFVFAYGACIGSLINVIVYRRPRGISVVTPPSRCPSCDTRLTWRDNIPVFGWLILRGRCRYCKAKISPEYPIVEAAVGLLFCVFYFVWYVLPDLAPARFLGVNWSALVPVWCHNEASVTWPTFLVLLILLSCLVAMTIIDARTFTIPLELTWIPAGAAVLIHTVHAAIIGLPVHRAWIHDVWAIPTGGRLRWDIAFAAIGGVVGIGVGVLFLQMGWLRRSFADYAEWEKSVTELQSRDRTGAVGSGAVELPAPDPGTAAPVTEIAAPPATDPPSTPEIATLTPAADAAPADLWIQYPHARREMLWEVLFLAPCLLLMFVGLYLGRHLSGLTLTPLGPSVRPGMPLGHSAPMWLTVLGGVLLGYLVGGGVVWGVRILGSLTFGKEAMGLGDVHLMAAVGACLGWIDATLAFFGAAFVGLAWVILSMVIGGGVRRTMPYGPYLAISTVLIYLGKPVVESAMSWISGHTVVLPP